MIRLVLLLCAGLYVVALVLGADYGQKRHGLMLADRQPKPATVATPSPTIFVPAQPVMQPTAQPPITPPPAQTAPETTALDTTALDTSPLPNPEIAGGVLYSVTARQANVRDGPGRSFGVTASLSQGEQVLVIPEAQPIQGWSRIRIEGDGVEGYVSTTLLTKSR